MARETRQQRSDRIHADYDILTKLYPDAHCSLNFDSPFQLVVATVLSAQTTDIGVNKVTPTLFKRYPTPEALAAANPEELEDIIHSLGFFRSKAKHLIGLGSALTTEFDGIVPPVMDQLITLPGVGRKTANVVLGNAFGIPGFPVDTHVMRVTGRLRWRTDWRSKHPDPVHVEREITSYFPPEEWTVLSHRLIYFGREYCTARSKDCRECLMQAALDAASGIHSAV
ncbi:endonuclease III [Bifidobacterium aquikefiricola]|uniref:Endonuclease III n=1 Tax=Bifidobacterium aquikefiricola TaxID=3059038 RepID=A0AB39U5S5_9BIFI